MMPNGPPSGGPNPPQIDKPKLWKEFRSLFGVWWPFWSEPGKAYVLQIQQIAYPTHIRQVAKTSILGTMLGSIVAPFWGHVLRFGASRRHKKNCSKTDCQKCRKLFQNGVQMGPKVTQNRSKMDTPKPPDLSLRALWGVLGWVQNRVKMGPK